MAKRRNAGQLNILEARISTAPCVPPIREAVQTWVDSGYRGCSETTRTLLNFWFHTDHKNAAGERFRYHYFQQRAIETLIYLYEIRKIRRYKELIEAFAQSNDLRLLQYDEFPRFAIKMATGSGKTKVISLVVAWQYFNAIAEGNKEFCRSFLVVAPNVIVYERLLMDFEGGAVFFNDPVIPPELKIYWDLEVRTRDDVIQQPRLGVLHLTNIQQLYARPPVAKPHNIVDELLGPVPDESDAAPSTEEMFKDLPGPALIINDEAHHTHDEENEWNRTVRRIGSHVSGGVGGQFDFSATPRHARGQLFSWTVFDYPLKQAIIDNVVKRPIKGMAKGMPETRSTIASVAYQAYLVAAVERWREYQKQLLPLKKKPILFVMLSSTADADEVADWLRRKYPEAFAGDKLLVIHTDRSGDVSKKDVEKARQAAREVDRADNPVNAIVSVLMLREGWDVQNVTVVLGLRPYSAAANILPEQTIGRGLRLMFRNQIGGYTERVDIIGNKRFLEFVEQLEREEDLDLETFELGKDRLQILTIMAVDDKKPVDISVPLISPVLIRKRTLSEEIEALDVGTMEKPGLPFRADHAAEQTFRYEGYDLITLQKLVEREYDVPVPQTAEEVIGYYARRIAQEIKLPTQFSLLAPKVRQFVKYNLFAKEVDLDDSAVIGAISSNLAHYITVKAFTDVLKRLVIEEQTPKIMGEDRRVSETQPFPWNRLTTVSDKCVFNYVPCENKLERDFAKFLHDAADVVRFAKLPTQFGFSIEYIDNAGNLRFYEPDFAVVVADGRHFIAETKGREDTTVASKDAAAKLWCESATALTGVPWHYIRANETEFRRLEPTRFEELEFLGTSAAMGDLFDTDATQR